MKSQLEYLVARMDDQQAAQLLEKAGVEFDSPHGKLKVKRGKDGNYGMVDEKGGNVDISVGALTGASVGGQPVEGMGVQEGDRGHMFTQINSGETLRTRAVGKTGQVFETVQDVPSFQAANRHRQMQQAAAAGSQNDPKIVEQRVQAQNSSDPKKQEELKQQEQRGVSAPVPTNPDPNKR